MQPFVRLLLKKAGSLGEMLRDRPQVYVYPDHEYGEPFEPPCEIVDLVKFIDGVCPFSGHSDCRDCISNEFDATCMWYLCNSDKFGLA